MTGSLYAAMEMKTGVMDGWYSRKDEAIEMTNYMSKELYPWGEWIVVEKVFDAEGCSAQIHDHRFHASVLVGLEYGTEDFAAVAKEINAYYDGIIHNAGQHDVA